VCQSINGVDERSVEISLSLQTSGENFGDAAVGVLHERGSIEPGKVADLSVIDISDFRFGPFADPWFGFVRAGYPGDVRDVIVGGQMKVRNGQALGSDESGIVTRAWEAGRDYLARNR